MKCTGGIIIAITAAAKDIDANEEKKECISISKI